MNEHQIEVSDIKSFGDIFEDVATNGSVWTITKDGEPVAYLLPQEDWQALVDVIGAG